MLLLGLDMAEETVLHGDVAFPADENVGVFVVQVGEEVEGEDHGAVGGVFERDNAAVCGAGLDGGEDIFDCDLRGERVCVWVEGVESSLPGIV